MRKGGSVAHRVRGTLRASGSRIPDIPPRHRRLPMPTHRRAPGWLRLLDAGLLPRRLTLDNSSLTPDMQERRKPETKKRDAILQTASSHSMPQFGSPLQDGASLANSIHDQHASARAPHVRPGACDVMPNRGPRPAGNRTKFLEGNNRRWFSRKQVLPLETLFSFFSPSFPQEGCMRMQTWTCSRLAKTPNLPPLPPSSHAPHAPIVRATDKCIQNTHTLCCATKESQARQR